MQEPGLLAPVRAAEFSPAAQLSRATRTRGNNHRATVATKRLGPTQQGPLAAALHQPGGDGQEPAPPAGGLNVALRFEQAHEQVPEVVDEQEQPGGQRADPALARAEADGAALVLEFVEESAPLLGLDDALKFAGEDHATLSDPVRQA